MSENKKNNSYKSDKEKKQYKRDTILMLAALLFLFLSPIAITIYSNYQEQLAMNAYTEQIEESLASSSEAEKSEADEDTDETEGDEDPGSETDNDDADAEDDLESSDEVSSEE